MKLLTQDELKTGLLTWYTVPEPLGFGRVVVCDLLLSNGRIRRHTEMINAITFSAASFMLQKYLLSDVSKRLSNIFINL